MIILELLRVVDNNGNDTNEILEREELHNRGKLHNEVTIYIINNKKISLISMEDLFTSKIITGG